MSGLARFNFIPLFALLLAAAAGRLSAFAPVHRQHQCGPCIDLISSIRTFARKDNHEDKDYPDDYKDDNEKRLEDLIEVNKLATQKRPESLVFLDYLQRGVAAAGWTFLILGVILNIFGYDYVMKDGRLTIDTMDASQFRQEVIKAARDKDY